MTEFQRRFKIKIKNEESGRKWVKAYPKDGEWRFVLRGEYSATKFPESMLYIDELIDFLSDKDFEIVLFSEKYYSNIL